MTLRLDDLNVIYREVYKCCAKWYNIGLRLKVSVGTLDAIRSRFDDPRDCLREALKEWLKTSESAHTWSTLAAVLKSRPVGEGVLGCELENRIPEYSAYEMEGGENLLSYTQQAIRRWPSHLPKGIVSSFAIPILAMVVAISYDSYLFHNDSSITSRKQTEIDKYSLYGYCRSEGEAPHNLPYLFGRFIGRDDEVKNITELLIHPSISHINTISIYGRPAVGKSTLAIHVGFQMAMCGVEVRYVNVYDSSHLFEQPDVADSGKPSQAKSQPSQKDSTEMLQPGGNSDLQFPVYSDRAQNYVKLSPHGLLKWAKGIRNDTLLILDNCDDLLEDKLFIDIVRALTEASAVLRIIITSRQKVTIIGSVKAYYLRELDTSSAIELLQFESDNRINYMNSEIIAELIGNNPLALHIAAKLVDDMHPDNVLIANLRANLIKTLTSVERLPENQNISHLLQLSYDRLHMEIQACGYYLSLLPGSINQDAATSILSNCHINDPSECLNDLEASSLLEPYLSGGQPRFQYHRLIREYFKHKSHEREGLHLHERVAMFNTSFQLYFSDALYNMAISYRVGPRDELIGRVEVDTHNFITLLDMYLTTPVPSFYWSFEIARYIFLSDLSMSFLPKEQLLRALFRINHLFLNDFIIFHETDQDISFVHFNLAIIRQLKHLAYRSSSRTLACSCLCNETLELLIDTNDSFLLSRRFYEYVLVMVYYRWSCWADCTGVYVSLILNIFLLIIFGIKFGLKSALEVFFLALHVPLAFILIPVIKLVNLDVFMSVLYYIMLLLCIIYLMVYELKLLILLLLLPLVMFVILRCLHIFSPDHVITVVVDVAFTLEFNNVLRSSMTTLLLVSCCFNLPKLFTSLFPLNTIYALADIYKMI